MNGFKPPNVFVDVVADLHLEETKPSGVPLSCQGQRLFKIANRDGNVCFSLTQIRSTPEFPHRELPGMAMGVDQRRLQGTTRCRLSRCHVLHVLCCSRELAD